jgi:predicted GH43/DUF377 family glycosyl hydrolase
MKNLTRLWWLAIVLAVGAGQAAGQNIPPWTKDARNPVFSGVNGTWSKQVFSPCVLFNADASRYEMWFGASSGTTSDWRPYHVGFATSKDGISWTNPSAVLSPTPGTWDAYTVEIPTVIRENGGYKMWYSGSATGLSSFHIGYATSPDGINWKKDSGNPVLGPGKASWEDESVYSCAVMPFQGGYQMWYGANDVGISEVSIGYATSTDGIIWQRDTANNPVLKPGASGWESLGGNTPRVLHNGGTYYLWYEGWPSLTSTLRQIGLAVSNDTGRTWMKDTLHNPVLSVSPGKWDARNVEPGSVLRRGDTLDMWYDGEDNSFVYRIGHAITIITAISDKQQEVPQHFTLSQNYPNPFNPTTVVSFQLPVASNVKLNVYDVLGREVATLVNERKMPGTYEVKFDGSNLASGVYFYRLQAGDFTQTKRLLLLK